MKTKQSGLVRGFGTKIFLGGDDFRTSGYYAKSVELKQQEETGIWNEYFIEVYDEFIDMLKIKVFYCKDNCSFTKEIQLPLVQYKSKNEYIFPLKGSILISGNFNSLIDHRQHYSMEFAFDAVQLNVDQKLCFKENMSQKDYLVFGKEIFAIADGEVVDCYHSFPITTSWDWEQRKPYIDEFGLAAQCGNFIVLKHANEEYSFYAHLIMDSLTVKKGDKIKQGQVIGQVGHTGLPNCPHLHFQLMDGPDFLSARGLPCSFTNIQDVAGRQINFIEEDNLIVHAG